MSNSRTKIAQELSPTELAEFCAALKDVPHGEMAGKIIEMAAARGISIGKSGAYVFKEKEVMPFIKRLHMRREKSDLLKAALSEQEDDDSARRLSDFTADELAQIAFDAVTDLDGKLDLTTEEGLATFDVLTKSVKRLRDGDRAMFRQLQTIVRDTRADLQNTELSETQRAERMRARFGV